DVDGDGNPDLRLHRILGGAEERFDAKVLLDPFEEEFDLPATAIQRGDSERRQGEVIGEHDQRLPRLQVLDVNTSQRLGEVLLRVEVIEHDRVVAAKTGAAIHRVRIT